MARPILHGSAFCLSEFRPRSAPLRRARVEVRAESLVPPRELRISGITEFMAARANICVRPRELVADVRYRPRLLQHCLAETINNHVAVGILPEHRKAELGNARSHSETVVGGECPALGCLLPYRQVYDTTSTQVDSDLPTFATGC